jgi:hypothetical protein
MDKKTCIICLRSLDIRWFHRCSKSTDEHNSYCKKCIRDYNNYKKEQKYKEEGKTFMKKHFVYTLTPKPKKRPGKKSSFVAFQFQEAEFEQRFD